MVSTADGVVSLKLSATGSSPETSMSTAGGLIMSTTASIRSFLMAASKDSNLSEDLRELVGSFVVHSDVPYKTLKTIWFGSERQTRPDLSCLLAGSICIFASPKPREKSEELKARLKKLQEAAERKAYDELVKDIAPRKVVEEPFSSYKDQIGFGLHVVVTMFTGYLVGYAAFRALFSHNRAMSAAGGILGLVLAMLVETLLFIFRSSDQIRRPPSSTTPSNLKIKKKQ